MKDTAALAEKQNESVISHYATLAYEYDRRWNRYSVVSLELLAKRLDMQDGEALLDLACGTGRLGGIIRERTPGVDLTGMDLSPDMIKMARGRIPEDAHTRWLEGSMEALPFDDASFDAVSCSSAFHLLTDQRKAMSEMVRVLRPGGRLCIVDWCRQYPQIQLIQWLARTVGRQYRRILMPDELSALMSDAGLEVASSEKFNATWFWAMMCILARKPG